MVTRRFKSKVDNLVKKYTILIVDDDPDIIRLIKAYLSEKVYKVLEASDGESAMRMATTKSPDLMVLDVNMPGLSGLEVCRNLRADKKTHDIPIIILSARKEDIDRVIGLEFGADDYVTKPFNIQELVLRINNVLKRVYGEKTANDALTYGVLSVDFARHEVKVKNKAIKLTLTEFKLLACLLENPGQVQSRDYLLETIWEHGEGVYSRTVDTHIQRLRNKLDEAGQYIETVRGIGYRLQE